MRSSGVSATAAMFVIFLAVVSAAAVIPAPYPDGAADSAEDAESGPPLVLLPPAGARADKRADDSGRWILGLGVLSNMQQFFDNLRSNLETIESMPKEEREALLGQAPAVTDQEREMRPKATAAYLHALRNHRPSYKIRNFVAESETRSSHGNYDPGYLWTGLGRKR